MPEVSDASMRNAQPSDVANARGDSRVIEIVEQRDRELARGAEQIAIHSRGYLRIHLKISGEMSAGRIEWLARVIEISRDLDDLALALERRQHAAKFSELRRRQLQRLGQLLQLGRLKAAPSQFLLDARDELAVAFAQLHAMALQPQRAFLAHDVGLARESVRQRAIVARADFIGQPRAQRFHRSEE